MTEPSPGDAAPSVERREAPAARGSWSEEVAADPRLWRVGALLSVGELLCIGQLWRARADRMLARGGEPLCWPFWPGCGEVRILERGTLTAFLVALTAMALATSVAFVRRSRAAMPLLASAMAVIVAVAVQDFRLRQNQHYMLAITVAAFVALPNRGRVLRYLVVCFYFWAGLLKCNREWLSGAALYRPIPGLGGALLKLACAWVVLLELVLIFGLLSRRRAVLVATLVQLGLFTIASSFVVGPFYPALMTVLILAAVSMWRPDEPSLRLLGEPPTTLAVVAAFSALQLWPRHFPGDTAITGEGRIFALHMFDARVVCESTATLRVGDRIVRVLDARPGLPIRTACDPASLYARGKSLCARVTPPMSVDLHLASRRSSEETLHTVVDLRDFCREMPAYRMLRHNEWIHTE